MHFVGNRAIVLANGERELQLYYNPGFTTLSVFLPIVFLFLGFTTVEFRQPGQPFFWPSLVFAGTVAGLAITGMHYVGNFGINNYNLENPPQYVVGAGLIAVFACCIALALFFYFKGKWINSLPRRVACACLLAGAVSGMHWTASVGTKYKLGHVRSIQSGMSRDTNLIVAIVLVKYDSTRLFSIVLTISRVCWHASYALPSESSPNAARNNSQIAHSTSCLPLSHLILTESCWLHKKAFCRLKRLRSNTINGPSTTSSTPPTRSSSGYSVSLSIGQVLPI